MLLMLLILLLVQANGLTVTPWCWLIFGIQAACDLVVAMAKAMK